MAQVRNSYAAIVVCRLRGLREKTAGLDAQGLQVSIQTWNRTETAGENRGEASAQSRYYNQLSLS